MDINYHKIDSKILLYDLESIEFKFGMWITKKEFGQRLNTNNPLPKGQFYMSVRVVSKDIETTEKIVRRLIKQFTKLNIIRLIAISKSPKNGSIYEYLVQAKEGTVEDIVRAQLGHSKSEGISQNGEGKGHSNGTKEGTVKGTSKKKSKSKENNIYDANDYEDIWKLYPNKKGKVVAVKRIPEILKQYKKEELIRSIERYSNEVQGKEKQYILNGSTFFNGRYEDYLDSNYEVDKQVYSHVKIEDMY